MKKLNELQWIERKDNMKCLCAKKNGKWEVYIEGSYTGYAFNSFKKAKEYCLFGF